MENNTPNPTVDCSDLFSQFGAKPCARCGKLAAIPDTDPRTATPRPRVWFCFECGHEERPAN